MSPCRIGKPIIIVGGIASGKTQSQVEQFQKRFPEWANLISSVVSSGAYRVITASSHRLRVEFAEPHWNLVVHRQAPGWWVAELHDLDECAENPETYIAPMMHQESEDKLAVARMVLEKIRAGQSSGKALQ